MKYFLLLLVVLAGVWRWRQKRRAVRGAQESAAPTPQLQDMVCCTVCAVHLPLREAERVRAGVFCCPEHASSARRAEH